MIQRDVKWNEMKWNETCDWLLRTFCWESSSVLPCSVWCKCGRRFRAIFNAHDIEFRISIWCVSELTMINRTVNTVPCHVSSKQIRQMKLLFLHNFFSFCHVYVLCTFVHIQIQYISNLLHSVENIAFTTNFLFSLLLFSFRYCFLFSSVFNFAIDILSFCCRSVLLLPIFRWLASQMHDQQSEIEWDKRNLMWCVPLKADLFVCIKSNNVELNGFGTVQTYFQISDFCPFGFEELTNHVIFAVNRFLHKHLLYELAHLTGLTSFRHLLSTMNYITSAHKHISNV